MNIVKGLIPRFWQEPESPTVHWVKRVEYIYNMQHLYQSGEDKIEKCVNIWKERDNNIKEEEKQTNEYKGTFGGEGGLMS